MGDRYRRECGLKDAAVRWSHVVYAELWTRDSRVATRVTFWRLATRLESQPLYDSRLDSGLGRYDSRLDSTQRE